MTTTSSFAYRAITAACVSLLALSASPIGAQSVVPPVSARGPHAVACSDVEQDLSRVPAGETAEFYWRGVSQGGVERYVTSLLVNRGSALVGTFTAPDDPALFGRWSARTLTYASLVCYPTSDTNTRANYALPRGVVVPRMQRDGQPPIFGSSSRLPVLLFSHGYGGSPLSGEYLDAIIAFASWGYVVVAPFHGDFRYSVFGPDNGGNPDVYVPIWDEFVAMQATRPLSLSAALDLVANHAQWRDHVDLSRVGAFGISQGGETIMLAGGAGLTYDLANHHAKRVTIDSRIRAAVGYVPYFGIEAIPAFGAGQAGVDAVTLPYLALSGTDDAIAPFAVTRAALDRMIGVRGHVALEGQGHELELPTADDIVTWTLTFLSAWVDGDASARAKLETMQSVANGLDDHKALYTTGVANYQGLWWNPSESGWGINFTHQGDALYMTWYTYDETGKASWIAMLAHPAGPATFAGEMIEVRGSPYDVVPYDPTKKVVSTVGTGTIAFSGPSSGTFSFEAKGVSRSIPITRLSLGGALPVCAYTPAPDLPGLTNYQELWWGGLAEDGWGVNVADEGGSIYATWYTFDTDGSALWFTALLVPQGNGTYEGTLMRSSGPVFGPSFDPGQVATLPVGTATLAVGNGNATTWRYAIGAVEGSKTMTRLLFAPPAATVCR